MAANQPDVAFEQYRELIRAEPAVAGHHYLAAQALLAKQEVPGAIRSLEEAERLDPKDPVPLSLLAYLLQKTGRNQEAASKLRRVLELRPDDPNTMNNLAYLLAESEGQFEEALQLAQKAIRAAPQNHAYSDTLGMVYLKNFGTREN